VDQADDISAGDERLIQAAVAGDREAFGQLVRRHQARLRAQVALAVADRDDVLDIVQESFVDAWRGLDRFDTTREFGPWLRTICRNRVLKHLRDRLPKRRRELALVDEALIACVPEEASGDLLATLRRCLATLDASHRQLLERRYHDGVAVQELAGELGKTPNAVSMILIRLKTALQRCMAGAPA
jgi:RNA polymerase sigma-70 factor (ECF subfamily)